MRFTSFILASLITASSLAVPLTGNPTKKSNKVARACAPLSSPTAPYTVVASKPNSPIHYLPMNAGEDRRIILGGEPHAYCDLDDQSLCPPGVYTVFAGYGSLDVAVPGGQQVFAGERGHLGFTAAHSATIPDNAVLDPFTYDKEDQCNFLNGVISTEVFGGNGLMGCPTLADTTDKKNVWLVIVSMSNATVPTGSIDDCIGFQALTYDYEDVGGYNAVAWAYA